MVFTTKQEKKLFIKGFSFNRTLKHFVLRKKKHNENFQYKNKYIFQQLDIIIYPYLTS